MDDFTGDLLLGWPLGNSSLTGPASQQSPLDRARARSLTRAIRYADDRHLLTFAPTGSGKGVSLIIPNLLHYPGPVIVIDPKGENFAVTATYRKKVLKQKILLLDPFRAVDDRILNRIRVERCRLNPLDIGTLLPESADLHGNAALPDGEAPAESPDAESQMLAEIFVGPSSTGENEFWDISAKRILAALFAHEMEKSRMERRPSKFSKIVHTVFSDDDPIKSMAKLLDEEKPSKFVLNGIGGGLIYIDADVTRAGILACVQSSLSLFHSPKLLEWLDHSTISLGDIQHREDYTLYIVIPPNNLASHASLLRAWISVLMHAIMERKSKPTRRTLFILDECANLGELKVLRKAVTLLRGYGLQVWMFFQDLAQLQTLYPDSGTIINNCGVVQAFGLGRLAAADPIAKIIGTLKARDLLQMDERQQAVSMMPGKPQVTRLLRYYSDAAFKGRFDTNPLVHKVSSRKLPSVPVRMLSQPKDF